MGTSLISAFGISLQKHAGLVRHGVVGVACATLNLCIQTIPVYFFNTHYLVANFLSFAVLVPLSFFLQHKITFMLEARPHFAQFVRYAAQWCLLFAANLLLMLLFVEQLGLSVLYSSVLVTGLFFFLSYGIQRFWVFHRPRN